MELKITANMNYLTTYLYNNCYLSNFKHNNAWCHILHQLVHNFESYSSYT